MRRQREGWDACATGFVRTNFSQLVRLFPLLSSPACILSDAQDGGQTFIAIGASKPFRLLYLTSSLTLILVPSQ